MAAEQGRGLFRSFCGEMKQQKVRRRKLVQPVGPIQGAGIEQLRTASRPVLAHHREGHPLAVDEPSVSFAGGTGSGFPRPLCRCLYRAIAGEHQRLTAVNEQAGGEAQRQGKPLDLAEGELR